MNDPAERCTVFERFGPLNASRKSNSSHPKLSCAIYGKVKGSRKPRNQPKWSSSGTFGKVSCSRKPANSRSISSCATYGKVSCSRKSFSSPSMPCCATFGKVQCSRKPDSSPSMSSYGTFGKMRGVRRSTVAIHISSMPISAQHYEARGTTARMAQRNAWHNDRMALRSTWHNGLYGAPARMAQSVRRSYLSSPRQPWCGAYRLEASYCHGAYTLRSAIAAWCGRFRHNGVYSPDMVWQDSKNVSYRIKVARSEPWICLKR